MNDILLIGSRGMLGRAWGKLLGRSRVGFDTLDRPNVDFEIPQTIAGAITKPYRWVINCAAWTSVDAAEEHESQASLVNGHSVGVLAEVCARSGATLVHYSTDYVFDGKSKRPYPIDHPRDPINAYGRGKAIGEELLEASGAKYLMLRTSWLYAPWGSNFVRTMTQLASERSRLLVVDDQRGRPSSSQSVADASWKLMNKGVSGTFHVTDGGSCTWFELTREIAVLVGKGCFVEPCTTQDFPRPAPRPTYSVLSLDATEIEIGTMTPWRENLRGVVQELVK